MSKEPTDEEKILFWMRQAKEEAGQRARLERKIKAALAPDVRSPDGWISHESMRRLEQGGNDSKGTVPIHSKRSSTSCIPVYFASPPEEI